MIDAGELTVKQRDELLAEMTDEVAALCCATTTRQAQALGIAEAAGAAAAATCTRRLMPQPRSGPAGSTGALEALPTTRSWPSAGPPAAGLTAPELAVLLAYAKIDLERRAARLGRARRRVPGRATLAALLPAAAARAVRRPMAGHRLRREIVATLRRQQLVNRAGITFAYRLGRRPARRPRTSRAPTSWPARCSGSARVDGPGRARQRVPAEVQLELQAEGRK